MEQESGKKFMMLGDFVHSTDQEALVILTDHLLGVDSGKIVFFEKAANLHQRQSEFGFADTDIIRLKRRQFVMPGMVDTHIHAPQYPNAGKGLDLGLLDWLKKYTYPTEAKFKDAKYATDAYRRAVKRVLLNGTTTACYFATIHTDASLLLCDIIEEFGQRAYVGKCNVDMLAPDYYKESTEESLSETKRFIETVFSRQYKLVTPAITPRFSVCCSDRLLKGLGELLKQYENLPVQTHIAENVHEVDMVKKVHPYAEHYTDSYDRHGLLTDKTVLAHGIYLDHDELKVIRARGSSLSHCPNSNLSIRSGLFDTRRVLQHKIKIGLGTDVSGGYHPSIIDAMRTAIHVSNTHAIMSSNGYSPLDYKDAFSLATLGGSKALGLGDVIGNFEVGKDFDALVIDPLVSGSVIDLFEDDNVEDVVQKFIHTGDDRNITDIYVAGKKLQLKEKS